MKHHKFVLNCKIDAFQGAQWDWQVCDSLLCFWRPVNSSALSIFKVAFWWWRFKRWATFPKSKQNILWFIERVVFKQCLKNLDPVLDIVNSHSCLSRRGHLLRVEQFLPKVAFKSRKTCPIFSRNLPSLIGFLQTLGGLQSSNFFMFRSQRFETFGMCIRFFSIFVNLRNLERHRYHHVTSHQLEFENGRHWNLCTRISQCLENIQT